MYLQRMNSSQCIRFRLAVIFLFYIEKMRIACRRRAQQRHDTERKKVARTWKSIYIFRHKTIPPTLEKQVLVLVENNLNKSFSANGAVIRL